MKPTGMAFILHIADDLNYKSRKDYEDQKMWENPTYVLIDYCTHKTGVGSAGLIQKLAFMERVGFIE